METPRLLLASGIGNEWVGRNHHTHGGAAAITIDAPVRKDFIGPNHSVATLDFVHAGGAPWGGGVIFDLPLPSRSRRPRPVAPSHRSALHTSNGCERPPTLGTMSMVQEVPHELPGSPSTPSCATDSGCRSAAARRPTPGIRSSGRFHARTVRRMGRRAGGRNIESHSFPGGSREPSTPPELRAWATTRPLGLRPTRRVHGTSNVYVADASLHPTNGGLQPGTHRDGMRAPGRLPDALSSTCNRFGCSHT